MSNSSPRKQAEPILPSWVAGVGIGLLFCLAVAWSVTDDPRYEPMLEALALAGVVAGLAKRRWQLTASMLVLALLATLIILFGKAQEEPTPAPSRETTAHSTPTMTIPEPTVPVSDPPREIAPAAEGSAGAAKSHASPRLLTLSEGTAPIELKEGLHAVRFSSSYDIPKAVLTLVGTDGTTINRAVLGPGAEVDLLLQRASVVAWDTEKRSLTLRLIAPQH